MALRMTVLGSGTSSGIPVIGCPCITCSSTDPRDTRTRASVLVELDDARVLIDTSSDFRQQMLRHHVRSLAAVIFTHHHFDHISGFDDLRAINFITRARVLCFATDTTAKNLRRVFAYAFGDGLAPGTAAPMVELRSIVPDVAFHVAGMEILPLSLLHGTLDVMGFRIGGFAYCTDCNAIPPATESLLQNLDVLILDALRYTSHPTHFSLDEALSVANRLGAKRTFFTHVAHEMKHADAESRLPDNVRLAFDGLIIDC